MIVINRRGQKQQMSEMAYNKLSRPDEQGYRDGWRKVDEETQTVTNKPLPTGEKQSQPVSRVANVQKVENTVSEQNTQQVNDTIQHSPVSQEPTISQHKKDEFMQVIAGLAPAAIKEFFDRNNVKYDKRVKAEKLTQQFAEHLNYDILEFQKAFE